MKNEMELVMDAISTNEGLARVAVAAFVAPLNPTLEELADVKTAVCEAVTNAIIHGYGNVWGYSKHRNLVPPGAERKEGKVTLRCKLEEGILTVEVLDKGVGIEDISKAMEPLYTSKPELDRSGMGFSFMEAFMDDLQVESKPGEGTRITMKKKLACGPWIGREE